MGERQLDRKNEPHEVHVNMFILIPQRLCKEHFIRAIYADFKYDLGEKITCTLAG